MKNTALITLPKTSLTKVTKKAIMKRLPDMEELTENDGVVDKLWDMYQKQLKRTHEMMVLCDVLQKENEELKRNQKLVEVAPEEKTPKEEKERKLQPIGYDKLKTLTQLLKHFFPGKMTRTAYANALVHMLYMLYQLKGQAAPEQLFAAADLTDISGFRYIGFLKKVRMVKYSPTTKKGYYLLTDTGKEFIQGKLTTEEEFCKSCGIEAIYRLNLE
jgi:predicted transcriptional regulator